MQCKDDLKNRVKSDEKYENPVTNRNLFVSNTKVNIKQDLPILITMILIT